jgi:DNA polymerase III epsilon subunit-like protein
MNQQEIYFSVDIEASGPIPGEYSMLSLGACLVDAVEHTFYAELRPISDRFVPAALEVTGFDLRELSTRGQQPITVMQNLLDWVTVESHGVSPVFVGFNAGFDWSFVNWYFHKFVGKNPFGVAPLDIKAYYMGLAGCLWDETRSSKLPQALKPARAEKNRHNALSDAVYQAGIFRRMMELRSELSG